MLIPVSIITLWFADRLAESIASQAVSSLVGVLESSLSNLAANRAASA